MAGLYLSLLASLFIAASSGFSGVVAIQDVSLIIKYNRFGTPQYAECITDNRHANLALTVLPHDPELYSKILYSGTPSNTIKTVILNELTTVQGVICTLGGKPQVYGHIQHFQVSPEHRSITLNKDEDWLLPLSGNTYNHFYSQEVEWKGPLHNKWNKTRLSNDNKLFITSQSLEGSGLYQVKYEQKTVAFVVMVRECPEGRYGSDCSQWCPDCLNGGICDTRSGECVCPPGVSGERCQTVCHDGYIGSNCNVSLGTTRKGKMVCTSAPVGCTCAPGYYGDQCNTECYSYQNKWGANCKQTCPQCYRYCGNSYCRESGYCSNWGICAGTIPWNCEEGDLGLPRLRQPPSVDSVTSQSVTVSFKEWKNNYDDGNLPSRGTLSYQLEYMKEGDSSTSYTTLQNSSPITLSDLEPLTSYSVSVLVMVMVGMNGQSCTATLGKVHSVHFNTTCQPLPKPEDSLTVRAYEKSLQVRWRKKDYMDKCGFRYKLTVSPKGSRTTPKTLYTEGEVRKVPNLMPDTEYTASLYICNQEWETCSSPLITHARTLDAPGPVTNLETVPHATSIQVSWRKPDDQPPRGVLESFRVMLREIRQGSSDTSEMVHKVNANSYTTSWWKTIYDLKPATKYEIKVSAKNQDVSNYGAAKTITAITTQGYPDPLQVKGLEDEETDSSVNLTWKSARNITGVTTSYNVSLYTTDNVLVNNTSVNVNHAQFEGLRTGQKYKAMVVPCNKERCGTGQELHFSMQPAQPRLQGTVDLEAANDSTITILIPLLINPPGWHFVVVQREGQQPPTQEWQDGLKDTAKGLVEKDDAGRRTRHVRPLHSDKPEEEHSKMYVAAKFKQVGNESLKVVLGDNKTYEHQYWNKPLTKDTAYWVVVVTEKRIGKHVKFEVTTPKRFVATSALSTGALVGISIGAVVMVILIAVLVWMLIMSIRKKRSQPADEASQGNDHSHDHVYYDLRLENFAVPLVQIKSNDQIDENIYSNARLHVNEKELEVYLLRAATSGDIQAEFEEVPAFMSNNYSVSHLPENHIKNRYRNKVTYVETGVVLPLYNEIPHSDYINANFVKGPTQPAAFIATQGPKDETVGAFWRMIWHTSCRVILMVANLKEGKKVKVSQYWPETQPWTVEGITVTPKDVTIKMDFVIRTFTLSVGKTQTEVCQYQYTAWPDHGVPKIAYGLAQMIKLVRDNHPHEAPITVHCSAGIGRTGTVILAMYLLDQLNAQGYVKPSEALTVLRSGRGRLVENTNQYIFAHQLLYEVLYGMKTSFPCHSFSDELQDLFSPKPPHGLSSIQLQYRKLTSLPRDLSFKYGKDPACAYLNRNQHILPADSRMVYVQGKGSGPDMQYINMIRVNGVDEKDAYLAGEHPLSQTLGKMWRLVFERKVPVWLLVHTFNYNDPEFPDVVCDSSVLLGNMTLTASPTQAFHNYDERRVEISMTSLGQVTKHQCLLITLRGWNASDNIPESPESLLSVIERVEALSAQHREPPFFTCKDGATGCGVVAALMLSLSRAKLLQEVDIFRSVASIQNDRPEFVVNFEQYEFLHTAMVAFLNANDIYGNFT